MSNTKFQFEKLAVVGVGLIGGSIAAAVRSRQLARTVIGCGRNRDRLLAAQAQGLLTAVTTSPEEIADADLIIVCTPVDRLAVDLCMLLEQTSASTLITDVGSVKGSIVQQVRTNSSHASRFIPAHPIAGSHLQGFEHADPDLCQNRLCILSPLAENLPADVQTVRTFWQSIGMRVTELAVEEHDRILALTSHLPHLAASITAAMVHESWLQYAATGYRDTTRVAAGDPELWTAIFTENTDQLAAATDQFINLLTSFRNSLKAGQKAEIQALLKLGQTRRSHFCDPDLRPKE